MELSRRGFIKLSGLAATVLVIKPVSGLLPQIKVPGVTSEAIVGKRWAMVVNIKACKDGCTDCIDACHSIHNVPDFGNPKDEVKWLSLMPFEQACPDQEHHYLREDLKHRSVVVLCNHCDNPACVRVCPTGATWKREDGIVMMDYHRCIGCRYCMAACPYGSRSFNWRDPRPFIKEINTEFPTRTRGVVEKCNFCAERLVKGQIPACVEKCKDKALIFGDLEDPTSEIRAVLHDNLGIRRKPNLGTMPEVYYIV